MTVTECDVMCRTVELVGAWQHYIHCYTLSTTLVIFIRAAAAVLVRFKFNMICILPLFVPCLLDEYIGV